MHLLLKELLYSVMDFALLTIMWVRKRGISAANGQEKLVVLKLDVMGDYVLMWPFLRHLKAQRPSLHITLVGNSVNAELGQTLDADVVDKFVWIDSRGKFLTSLAYRWRILKQIAGIEADMLLHPTENRITRTESLVKLIRAKEKIGVRKTNGNLKTDRLYSKILTPDNQLFEFERQRAFFTLATGLDFSQVEIGGSIQVPSLGPASHSLGKSAGAYAMLFVGAGFAKREWPAEFFGEVAEYLHNTKRLRVLIAGTAKDAAKAAIVKRRLPEAVDLTEMKLPMAEILCLMAEASVVVSNESGPVHLAAGLGVHCVSISNGNHFGWYSPYPVAYRLPIVTVLHPAVAALLPLQVALAQHLYGAGSRLPMAEIAIPDVVAAIDKLLPSRSGN